VAHRALVAYERTDGDYDLHRSRWGGTDLSLARRITAETPYGGERTVAAWVRRGPSPGPTSRPVERRPVATGLDFDAVVDAVDFRQHEALFVVAPDYGTAAYLPLWFGLTGVAADAGERDPPSPRSTASREDAGALVAADPGGGPYGGPRLRRWFRATKAVVADVVAAERFSRGDETSYLADRVRKHVGERREVIVRE